LKNGDNFPKFLIKKCFKFFKKIKTGRDFLSEMMNGFRLKNPNPHRAVLKKTFPQGIRAT